MEKQIIKMGRALSVSLITVFSIALSLGMTITMFKLSGQNIDLYTLFVASVVPLIAASTTSSVVVNLFFEIHQIKEEMQNLVTYDVMTGLLTRRVFLTSCKSAHQIAYRKRTPFSFVSIDIDNFKKINDLYGHAGGDAVLQSFGEVVKQCTRASDLVGRIGGEEFALALPDTDTAGAVRLGNIIRLAVKRAPVDYLGQTIRYTLSIGVAQVDSGNSNDLEQLIRQSDEALYMAKNSGKDRVSVYEPSY
jgi:diguanylate cyclase (GGDEF)-like protein